MWGRHSCLPAQPRADRNVRATLGTSNESNESKESSESILALECQVFALPEYRLQGLVDLFPARINQELKNSGKVQECAVSTNKFLIS